MEEKIICTAEFKENKIVKALPVVAAVLIVIGLIFNISMIRYGILYMFFNPELTGSWIMYPAYLLLLVYSAYRVIMHGCTLTVTNKKVSGKASFRKQVDLPLNKISSVGLSWASSISIGTSSGRLMFWLISNREEVYNAISDLLSATENNEGKESSNNADMSVLKNLKELLDAGVITQEEFDAKKKQILGL